MPQYAFTLCYRIRRPREYQRLFDGNPVALSSRCFRVLCLPNSLPHPRLGVIVSKRCAKLAVRRNRIKRIVREYFRHHQAQLDNIDIVVIAKAQCFVDRNSGTVGWTPGTKQQLHKDLNKLWQRLVNNT